MENSNRFIFTCSFVGCCTSFIVCFLVGLQWHWMSISGARVTFTTSSPPMLTNIKGILFLATFLKCRLMWTHFRIYMSLVPRRSVPALLSQTFCPAFLSRDRNWTDCLQLAKVGLPFPLSLSKPTDNKWKCDYIYYKQNVVNHSLGLELETMNRGFRLQRHWIITLVIYFKIKLFPRCRSLPLFIDGTKWHFPGQNDRGTERRDRKVGQKGISPGQNGKGTERRDIYIIS